MSSKSGESLPIIDMRKKDTAEDELSKKVKNINYHFRRRKICGVNFLQIVDGLENAGFLYIEGVDVDFSKLFEACQWFFALDIEEKMKIARRPYNPNSTNFYRGYFPVIEGEASRKEAIEFAGDWDTTADARITSGDVIKLHKF